MSACDGGNCEPSEGTDQEPDQARDTEVRSANKFEFKFSYFFSSLLCFFSWLVFNLAIIGSQRSNAQPLSIPSYEEIAKSSSAMARTNSDDSLVKAKFGPGVRSSLQPTPGGSLRIKPAEPHRNGENGPVAGLHTSRKFLFEFPFCLDIERFLHSPLLAAPAFSLFLLFPPRPLVCLLR